MPELPEVETTRRGIAPHLSDRRVVGVVVRDGRLRWPVPADLPALLQGVRVGAVSRRAKYMLLDCGRGHLIIHLGMTGSLRLVAQAEPHVVHDHIDIVLDDGRALRYRDPRRFGAMLWTPDPPGEHPLLRHLGPEPLTDGFDGAYLYRRARGRRAPVKSFVMDGRVVAGVGNIYTNEALFQAGIRPERAAGRISAPRYERLSAAIKSVLERAIAHGGTTLRDYVDSSGRPGYFRHELQVYGRGDEPCPGCGMALREVRIGQRSTVYCPRCQR